MSDQDKEALIDEARETFGDQAARQLREKLFSPEYDESNA